MSLNWKQLDHADPARAFGLSDADVYAICRNCSIGTKQINAAVARTRLSRMLIAPVLLVLSMPVAKYVGALAGIGVISASIVVVIRQVAAFWLIRRFTRGVHNWLEARRPQPADRGRSNDT